MTELKQLKDTLRKFAAERDWDQFRLADKLDVELLDAARSKMARNAQKYPIEKSRGNARKYTQL